MEKIDLEIGATFTANVTFEVVKDMERDCVGCALSGTDNCSWFVCDHLNRKGKQDVVLRVKNIELKLEE